MIPAVVDIVENDIFISNSKKVVISLTRFIGTVFGVFSVLSNERKLQNEIRNYFNITPNWSEGNKILLFAVVSVGYGYWGEYALEVEKSHVECSLYDFDRALAEYSSVLNDKTANFDPTFGVYLTSELNNKIEENLYCLKLRSKSQVVSELFAYVKVYTQLLSEKIAEVHEKSVIILSVHEKLKPIEHFTVKHEKPRTRKWNCYTCNSHFRYESKLKRHMEIFHEKSKLSKLEPLCCKEC